MKVAETRVIGDQKIRVAGLELHGEAVAQGVFLQGRPLTIEIRLESDIASDEATVVFSIHRNDGIPIWSATSSGFLDDDYRPSSKRLQVAPGESILTIELPVLQLNSGNYYVNAGVEPKADTARVADYHDWQTRVAEFAVVRSDHLIVSKAFELTVPLDDAVAIMSRDLVGGGPPARCLCTAR